MTKSKVHPLSQDDEKKRLKKARCAEYSRKKRLMDKERTSAILKENTLLKSLMGYNPMNANLVDVLIKENSLLKDEIQQLQQRLEQLERSSMDNTSYNQETRGWLDINDVHDDGDDEYEANGNKDLFYPITTLSTTEDEYEYDSFL